MKKIVTISLAETTLAKVDEYASDMGLSRSTAIGVMCENMINQKKSMDGMEKLMEAVNTLKETQKLGKIKL